jgi:hypothetical protein
VGCVADILEESTVCIVRVEVRWKRKCLGCVCVRACARRWSLRPMGEVEGQWGQ